MGIESYGDFLNADKLGLGRLPPIHFETELNCLFCPFQENIKGLCLCMAARKLRNLCDKIALLILLYNYGEFSFHNSFTSFF